MNVVTYFSLKKIKFLDQVLLLLLVKTAMGHKILLFFPVSFSSGSSLQNVSRMPFKSTCAGPWSQRSGGFHCLQSAHGTLSSPGEIGSWGVIAQEEFMELRLLSRGKAERHNASPVSLFHCFAIAGGSKKQTQNFFQFSPDLQVLERKFVSVQG